MKRMIVLVAVLGCAALVVRIWTAAPQSQEVMQCREKLDHQWIPMFRAAYESPDCQGDGSPSCPFAEAVRGFGTSELSRIAFAAEACAKADTKREFTYERVTARAENVMVMRAAYFIKNINQDGAFQDWEQSYRRPRRDDGQDKEAKLVSDEQRLSY
jgi:hypothetical protein